MLLHHIEIGQGQPLVLLHGLFGCADSWLPIARKLSTSFRVLCLDLRNHGRSPHAPTHTYADMAADVIETLDAIGVSRSHMLGHSMGGRVATTIAAMQPQRIDRLVLADIAPLSALVNKKTIAHIEAHRQTLHALQALDLSQLRSFAQIEAQLASSIPDQRLRRSMLKNIERNSDGHFSHRLNTIVLLQHIETIAQGHSPWRLPVHTLLLKGQSSDYVSPNDIEIMRGLCPTLTVRELPNAGHWIHIDCPQLVTEHTANFLSL